MKWYLKCNNSLLITKKVTLPASLAWRLTLQQRRQTEQVLQRAHAQAEHARQEAEQANHAKSTFLANMSHELRTPLNSILGYAQLLIQASQLSEHQRESIRIIMRSGEHLLTLINDVLDISKIEAGKLELFPSDFYLPEFLKEIVDLFRLRTTQKGLTFGYEQIPSKQ
jgi:signal transduction histidine kinase